MHRLGYAAKSTAAPVDADSASVEPQVPILRRQSPGEGPQRARCSFAQEQFWFVDQVAPGNLAYNFSWPLRLRGRLDSTALSRALVEVVRRHEALRTGFSVEDGDPVQVIGSHQAFTLARVDVAAESDPEEAAQRLVDIETQRPFDLRRPGLFRAQLIRLSDDDHILQVVVHHIVFDEWSKVVLYRELGALYAAFAEGRPSPLPEPRVQQADFAEWQRSRLTDELLGEELAHWTSELSGVATALDLPSDRPRPPIASMRGGRRRLPLPVELTERLEQLGGREGADFFDAFLALFEVLLFRYTGAEDFLIGVPADDRTARELDDTIGVLLSTVVLRSDLSGSPSFRTLLQRVRGRVLAAAAHAELPFELLVRELQPVRDLSRHPLYQVLLAINPPDPVPAFAGVDVVPAETQATAAGVDLFLFLQETPEGLDAVWEYNGDLFRPQTIERIHSHLVCLLGAAVDSPDRPVAELPMLSDEERQRLLTVSNGTEIEYSAASLHELVEARARENPEAPAVACEGEQLTYAELNARANQLARHLQSLGVGRDSVVAISLDRSPDLVVGALGILKAGGAYMPLDSGLPEERLAFMLADSKVDVLVTHDSLVERLHPFEGRIVRLDADWETIARADTSDLRIAVEPDDLAYVIYTSGSTGRPKGVLNTHRGIVNRLLSMQETYPIGPSDRLLQKTQIGFDVSVRELFWPLIHGARIAVATPGAQGNPAYLAEVIEREQITTLHFVPSMLQLFLEEADPARCLSLRCILSGGEPLPVDLVRRFFDRFSCELHNLYGPSEAAVSVTSWRCEPDYEGAIAPIGRPVANTQVYVLDSRLQPVPVGVWGELHIGGAQVARGYLDRPDLSAERFIDSPFSRGRLYRTGDLCRWTADGLLEIRGRLDDQVKVRGFRVEPGEIEAALREHHAVADSVVVAIDSPGGSAELAAYVVFAEATEEATSADLDAFLRARMPDYMVPASLTPLPELPRLPNGKLDREALPRPDRTPGGEYVAPQTPTEERLAAVWQELLEVERVGRDDNFFALGGHSLLAARLVGRVNRELGADVPLCSFLRSPTIAGLAAGLDEERPLEPELPPLVARTGVRETSFAQERFWFVEQVTGSTAPYNIPVALRLRGALDVPVLERVLSEIVRRHEILRTRFADEDGRPVQVVDPPRPLAVGVVDLRSLAADAREAEAKRLVDEGTATGFDLTRGPLFRARLLRLGDADHILDMLFDHLVFDGFSKLVLFRELAALYNAVAGGGGSPLPEPPLQYGDFAEWQRSWLQGELLERELAHWQEALAGMPTTLELPTDSARPAVASMRGARLRTALPAELVDDLQVLAQREGTTLYAVLLAAFDLLLQRYSGQDDIALGMPVDARDRPELQDAIGVFVDTVVLRVDVSGNPTFRELLERVRERMLDAIAHRRLPFQQLVQAVETERDLARHPLYQVGLTLVPADAPPSLARLDVEELAPERASAPIDLTVFLEPRGDVLEEVWEYSTDLFERTTIERMQGHFLRLLEAIVTEPDRRTGELSMLGEEERATVLSRWSAEGGEYPAACLHELFEARAAADPAAPAAAYEGESISYGQLNERANRLAHLLRDLGVGPEVPVALCLRRSLDLVVAIVGVLKAGGAYIPLDPDYPADRLAFVLRDAAPPVLLTQEELLSHLPPHLGRTVCLNGDAVELEGRSAENLEPLATPENLAYVIYTSGSTGQPKGVRVEHRNVSRLFSATDEWFGFGPEDTWLLFHSYAFDFSVWELWGALLHGGRLVVPPLWTTRAPDAIAQLLVEEGVTVFNATPTLFTSAQEELVRVGDRLALRYVIFGGEALHPSSLRPWFRRFGEDGPRLVNMYGITETTVHVTYRLLSAADCERDASPIGEPIPDLQVYLLDGRLEPVPPGVPGELFVGGAGVARGYLNRPELTAERFVPNPFGPGRLYRSGDGARYREDGGLEFLGRLDDQVKIRGFRIELGEIQATLAEHEAVGEGIVVASDGGDGDTRLAAYVVPATVMAGELRDALRSGTTPAGADALRAELRQWLTQRLPAFMVPASLTLLGDLPLTANGKLDCRALPAPVWEEQGASTFTAPRTPAEVAIAEMWKEILGLDRIGVDDDFFHLGGHSLLAARVATKVRERFEMELSVRTLFEHPTLRDFAEHVAAEKGGIGEEPAPAVAVTVEPGAYPPSFSQRQLLFIDELVPNIATYNGAFAVRIAGALEVAALEASIADVVARHEALHTVFRWTPEGPVQVVLGEWGFQIPVVELSKTSAQDRDQELQRLLQERAREPFDLARDLMIRATLYRLGAEEHVLIVVTHHIASDGWSVGIFCSDLSELYEARIRGRRPALPELPLQYRDFALWQRTRLSGELLERELAFWRDRLAGAPTVLQLPFDRPRPAQQTFDGASIPVELPAELAEATLQLSRAGQATPYMLLLALFAVLLYRVSGQDDVLIGGPVANRSRSDYHRLVGFFANTLVSRVRLAGNPSFAELLAQVRESVLGTLDHQELPFEQIVDAVRPRRDLGVNPLIQVNFRARVESPAVPRLGETETSRVAVDPGFAAFELALDLHVLADGIVGEFLYNTALFERETVVRLAEDYEALLRQVVSSPETRLLALELPSERHGAVGAASEGAGAVPIRSFRRTGSRTLD
jgi:amino acid adenylation domain-containing protein